MFLINIYFLRDFDNMATSTENQMEKTTNNKGQSSNQKNQSSNQIPKERNVSDTDTIIAENIMELHSRWYCKEHDRSCYVDSTRHISLMTNHLSTWARSIVSLIINRFIYNFYNKTINVH